MNIQTITNVNDCVPLYLPHSLYLKPLAKFYVSVSLPANKLGKTISNYDIMDKLNQVIKPDKVSVLKVSKSTLEFLRFEGELEDRSKLRNVLARLDGQSFKLSSFSESFKVRASEAKDEFPNRHDWDSFFRDARNMDEMKAGERPDTIHLSNLPNQWFCPRHQENEEGVKPSENIFKRIFEKFGSVRFVDIPICDPYRSQMKTEISGMKTFRFDQELMFEGYVQFSEYLSFVKAMDEFRGMKLVRKLTDKNQSVNIVVTFDKTKHLTDASIKRRNIVRDRLISKERAKHEEELQKKKEEEKKLEKERKHQEELKVKELELQREREEKRKEKHLKKLSEKGQLSLTNKIRIEEKKLLIAQRKLESIRLLEALFERIKGKESIKKEPDDKGKIATKLERNDLRNKLAAKYKSAQEELLQKQKTKLEQVKGKTGLLALIERNNRSDRSSSINTISSDDSVLSDSHQTGKSKKKKLKQKKRGNESDTSISSSPSESQKSKLEMKPLNSFTALYNPEMAAELLQQIGMYNPYASPMFPIMPSGPGMQISPSFRGNFSYRGGRGMYNPYASSMLPIMAAAAGMRPGYFHSSYRGNFPYRSGRFARNRGGASRISEYYDDDHNRRRSDEHDRRRSDDHDRRRSADHDRRRSAEHDRRRSNSYSRSRSRSRSNRRHRSKSRRSHSRSRRSRSRSHRSRSSRRKRTRSKSQSKSESKLVSTRRSRSSSSSSGWSRSRSKSQSRSWSRNHKHSHSPKVVLQTDKLVRSAREIQRSVQQKLHDRMKADEDKKSRNSESKKGGDEAEPSTSKQRSISVDSAKFMSPKHKAKSTTPEKEWKD